MVKSVQVIDISSYWKLCWILNAKTAYNNKSDKVALLGIVNKKTGKDEGKR